MPRLDVVTDEGAQTSLTIEKVNGQLVLVGELDSASAPALVAHLDPWAGDLTIDLRQVSFIDSSGLRTLIDAHLRAQDNGHSFVLCSPSPTARRLFAVAGVVDLFTIIDD